MICRPLLELTLRPKPSPAPDAPLEWLVANGLGGYASGSVDGPPMRRFHGLLIAALPAPLGRALLLHALHEVVELDGGPVQSLQSGRDGDPPVVPQVDFCLKAGLPQWTFVLADDVRLERSVVVPHGQNTVHVRYRLIGATGPALLRIRPWLDFRPHEGLVTPQQHLHYEVAQISATRCEFTRTESPLRLRMQVIGTHAAFAAEPREWSPIELTIERDRGYDHMTSAHGPGAFTLMLAPGEDAVLTASTEPWAHLDGSPPDQAWEHELTRRQRLLCVERREPAAAGHVPAGAGRRSVHRAAGDPRGRRRGGLRRRRRAAHGDRRLPLVHRLGPRHDDQPGRPDASPPAATREAHDILRTFALHVGDGLIPNLFPEGEREGLYHTADATLWFFHALHRYDTVTGDHALVERAAAGAAGHRALPSPGHARSTSTWTPTGCSRRARPTSQLTWMDAQVGDWVVTPRRGKAVEINALWHNALRLLADWRDRAGLDAERDDLRRKPTAADAASTHGSGTRRRLPVRRRRWRAAATTTPAGPTRSWPSPCRTRRSTGSTGRRCSRA